MIHIRSLKKIINEASPADTRFVTDIKAANEEYEKVREASRTWLGAKPLHWALSTNPKLAEAAADRDRAINLARKRLKASNLGMVPKEDYDEMAFQAVTAKRKAAAAAAEKVASSDDDKSNLLRKVGGEVVQHPLLAAGTVAGLAGLAALRKKRKAQQLQRY